MKHEIIEIENGRFALHIDGCRVGTYSRRRDAVRRLRTLAEVQECAAETADSREAAGGEAAQPTPTSNTGGTKCAGQHVSESYSHHVMVRGKLKEIPLRRGVGTSAHIDTLTITFREDVLCEEVSKHTEASKKYLACRISETVQSLMGFGIYEEKNGINGYKYSYRMGTDTANYGGVLKSVLIKISKQKAAGTEYI